MGESKSTCLSLSLSLSVCFHSGWIFICMHICLFFDVGVKVLIGGRPTHTSKLRQILPPLALVSSLFFKQELVLNAEHVFSKLLK